MVFITVGELVGKYMTTDSMSGVGNRHDYLRGSHVITYKNQGWYKKAAHRKWRQQVMQRDNWLCQECLRQNRLTPATEAHHIIPLEDRLDLALDVDNGEGLCWKCHELTKRRKKIESSARV